MGTYPAIVTPCPVCQRLASFTHPETNLIECTCGSVLQRLEQRELSTVPVSIVLHKRSGIQPGTKGKWEGRSFTVLGRIYCWFEESVFNYWTIVWNDDKIGWLAESYGLYFIMEPTKLDKSQDDKKPNRSKPGSLAELFSRNEFILNKKQVTLSWEAEGEVFLPFIQTRFTFFDYASPTGEQVTVVEGTGEHTAPFRVYPATFKSLSLEGLRQSYIPPKTFTCKQCQQPVSVLSYPLAQSCVCGNCGTPYSMQNGIDFKKDGSTLPVESMAIQTGSVGKLRGTEYSVVGYTEKEEVNAYHSQWREYTLFNEQEGFAFLSEYDGHWIYLKEAGEAPVVLHQNEKKVSFNGRDYAVFNSYTYKVVQAKGEFPYNIFDNQNTICKEYIDPPFIWIQERDKQEGIRWFSGSHISHHELRSAFPDAALKRAVGVGAVQPGSVSKRKLILATLVGLLAVFLAHFFTTTGNQSRQLFFNNYTFPDTVNAVSVVTGKYVFDKPKSNLKLVIFAPVQNSWFELGATLVNSETGKEYSLEKGVEYYRGVSDGESWSEGSNTENAYFTRIPAGTYFLQMQGTREAGFSGVRDFSVEAIYDVTNNRNLWFALLLFILWPLVKYLYSSYQENERWRNSPYAQFNE